MSWAEGVGSVVQVRATDVLEMKQFKSTPGATRVKGILLYTVSFSNLLKQI